MAKKQLRNSNKNAPNPITTATGAYLSAFRDMPALDFVDAVNSGNVATFSGVYLVAYTDHDVHSINFSALDRQMVRDGLDLDLAAIAILAPRSRDFGIIWINGGSCRRVNVGNSVIKAAKKKLANVIGAYSARMRGEKYIRIPDVISNKLPSVEHLPCETVRTSNQVLQKPDDPIILRKRIGKTDLVNATRRESAEQIFRKHFPDNGEELLIVTNGETDCFHMAMAFIDASGEKPLEIGFSTWAMSHEVATEIEQLKKTDWKGIPVIIVVSTLFKGRYAQQYAQLLNACANYGGRLICCNQHAKIFYCRTENHYLSFTSSANMDKNLNLETYNCYNDRTVFNYHRGVFNFFEYHNTAS